MDCIRPQAMPSCNHTSSGSMITFLKPRSCEVFNIASVVSFSKCSLDNGSIKKPIFISMLLLSQRQPSPIFPQHHKHKSDSRASALLFLRMAANDSFLKMLKAENSCLAHLNFHRCCDFYECDKNHRQHVARCDTPPVLLLNDPRPPFQTYIHLLE